MNPKRRVAVIGTGRMGGAMCETLHRAGFELTMWNRTADKAKAVAVATGGTIAASPAEAVRGADVALSSLADDEAVRSAYLSEDGVVAGLTPGQVVFDTSTIDPETVHLVGAAVDSAGAVFLDAPVSGSVSTVEAGTLTIMVGGDQAGLDEVEPVLDALASRVVHTGGRGTGSATKLAVNAIVHALDVALSEALVLAERSGVDRAVAYDVFASGAAGAPFVQYKRQSFEHPEEAPVAFSLDLVEKDLELITTLGKRLGVEMDQAATDLSIVRKAIAAGLGGADLSAIAVYLREHDR